MANRNPPQTPALASPVAPRRSQSNPYLAGGLDSIDVLRAKLDRTQFEGFCAGNAERRIHRGLYKGSQNDWSGAVQDWQTARWFIDQLLRNAGPVTAPAGHAGADTSTVMDYYSSSTGNGPR